MNALLTLGSVSRRRGSASGRSRATSFVGVTCFLAVAVGVVLAGAGMLRLDLRLMLAGAVLWVLGVVSWERATGRFH